MASVPDVFRSMVPVGGGNIEVGVGLGVVRSIGVVVGLNP